MENWVDFNLERFFKKLQKKISIIYAYQTTNRGKKY